MPIGIIYTRSFQWNVNSAPYKYVDIFCTYLYIEHRVRSCEHATDSFDNVMDVTAELWELAPFV